MRRPTWERVGGFDEGLQFHVDSDWLGRANQAGLRPVHVVQARADMAVDNWRVNMRLSTVVDGPRPVPLVTRTVREVSITGRIGREEDSWSRRELDFQRIRSRLGDVPW